MSKRRLRTGGRNKAAFGESVAAAGIMAAATLTAAGIGANAAKDSAKAQADAALKAARQNADALKLQNENSNKLQQQSIEFTKEQNEQNRELQRDVQLTLQTMAGQQSSQERREASKIQVRNGGLGTNRHSFLRGSNMPFRVTDGGGVIPIGITPEGYNLYELYGDNHEQYHKTKNGKYKSGVGIKFINGDVIEGEGDGARKKAAYGLSYNTNRKGELLLTTPEGGYFISKHNIKGFNPRDAVANGMNPIEAFNLQEYIKDINGISDDGKHNGSPVKGIKRKLRLAGGNLDNIAAQYFPQGLDFNTDTINPSVSGAIYANQISQTPRSLKCGGKTRHKAYLGEKVVNNLLKFYNTTNNPYSYRDAAQQTAANDYTVPTVTPINNDVAAFAQGKATVNSRPVATRTYSPRTTQSLSKGTTGRNWLNNNGQLFGAGLNAVGNIGGALLTNWGNNAAANILADAYTQAGQITADAYRNMTGIDMSNLRREDFAAAYYMPAIRSAFYNANPDLAGSERRRIRLVNATKRNSLSSAALLNRLGKIEVDSADERNRIYADKANREEQIRQNNLQAINEAATKNAQLATEANKAYGQAYLNLLQYNNNINNEKIAGIAEALSSGLTGSASASASARQANANAWANAVTQSTLGFSNTLSAMDKQRRDTENVMLGASNDAYYRNLMMNGTNSERAAAIVQLNKLIETSTGETKKQYEIWRNMLV